MASACITELGLAGASVTLADPYDAVITYNKLGQYSRMANRTLTFDGTGSAPLFRSWDIKWSMLSGTDQAVISAEAVRTGSQYFSPPSTCGVFSVFVTSYSETPTPAESGSIRYNINMRLEEL